MKLRLLTLLLIIPLLAADQDKEAAAKKDQDKLQGTWVVVAAEHDGQPLNLYRSVNNDPLAASDPSGMFPTAGSRLKKCLAEWDECMANAYADWLLCIDAGIPAKVCKQMPKHLEANCGLGQQYIKSRWP